MLLDFYQELCFFSKLMTVDCLPLTMISLAMISIYISSTRCGIPFVDNHWLLPRYMCHYCTLKVIMPYQLLMWWFIGIMPEQNCWLNFFFVNLSGALWYHERKPLRRRHSGQFKLRDLWAFCLKFMVSSVTETYLSPLEGMVNDSNWLFL